jgi:hypothetical protein
VPSEKVILEGTTRIIAPIYTYNQKKYITLELSPDLTRKVTDIHKQCQPLLTKEKKAIPQTNKNQLKVKVPFRYNKVECVMNGSKTIHQGEPGDTAQVKLEFCGIWEVGEWCGISWKLNEINL